MSITLIRPLFKTRLELMEFHEHTDGFAQDNIPATILEKAFHIMIRSGNGLTQNQNDQPIEIETTLSLWRDGYADPAAAMAQMEQDIQEVICDIQSSAQRLGSGLHNIVLEGFTIDPISDDNDNKVKGVIIFQVRVHLSTQ